MNFKILRIMLAQVLTTAPQKPTTLLKIAQINGQPFAVVPGETGKPKPCCYLYQPGI